MPCGTVNPSGKYFRHNINDLSNYRNHERRFCYCDDELWLLISIRETARDMASDDQQSSVMAIEVTKVSTQSPIWIVLVLT